MKITANVGVAQLGELTAVSTMLVLLELAKLLKEILGLLLLLSGHGRLENILSVFAMKMLDLEPTFE